jgi:lipopolysaccharide export system permease protein
VKILDKYLLKTFLITFTTVFVILFFIFILQTVWLFISELAGKDLDFILVIKFLLFSMPRIIPLVLPLSVLLSSIMTFGSLAENYEFAAMKSSGISFQRSMKSITIFILLLSIVSFFFADNVIPYAEYKFINFRRNIAQVKPAMAIAEGQFSEVGNYTIKVEKKSGKNGNFLTDVTIHKKLDNGAGNTTVIKARKGELVSSETSNTLKLVLTDGNYYEDIIPKNYNDRSKVPFAKGTFKRDVINIDLSKLNQNNMENVDISNNNTMLNIRELRYTLDSLNKNYKKDLTSYTENIYMRTGVANSYYNATTTIDSSATPFDANDITKNLDATKKNEVIRIAINTIENTGFSIDSSVFELEAKAKNINSHWITLYEKFMIAFSCILMFFIGAPLGSIIRKGGLGLPIVFAISIFIIFHFINSFGKRVAQENQLSAFFGVWMSSIILTPLAILLTYRAINDIGGMVSFDKFILPLQKLFTIKKKGIETTDSSNTSLENVSKKVSVTEKKQIVKKETSFDTVEFHLLKYKKLANIGLLLNGISLVLFSSIFFTNSLIVIVLGAIVLLILLYYIYKSQKELEIIRTNSGLVIEPGIFITMLTGFPFYGITYWYTKKLLKQLQTTE